MQKSAPYLNPRQRQITANGIVHNVLEWNETAETTLLLCHGFLDLSWSWVWVVKHLLAYNYRIIAFDWRGHGESSWIGAGGYYHFPDYVLDLAELVPQISRGKKIHLIGHSMGGVAATLFASIDREHLLSFINIEGWGPPQRPTNKTRDRVSQWIQEIRKLRNHPTRTMNSLEEVLRRLQKQHKDLDHEQAQFLAEKMAIKNKEEKWQWRFDPLHQTTSPLLFVTELFSSFGNEIQAPTLFISASDGLKYDDLDSRIRSVSHAKHIHMENVGHMIHWKKPEELATHIHQFVLNYQRK